MDRCVGDAGKIEKELVREDNEIGKYNNNSKDNGKNQSDEPVLDLVDPFMQQHLTLKKRDRK